MVWPHTDMNQLWVYMSPHPEPPPPSLPIPSLRVIQCTSPECPVSCMEPGLAIYFTYGTIHVSVLFSQIIPPSHSPTESKSLCLFCCLAYSIIINIDIYLNYNFFKLSYFSFYVRHIHWVSQVLHMVILNHTQLRGNFLLPCILWQYIFLQSVGHNTLEKLDHFLAYCLINTVSHSMCWLRFFFQPLQYGNIKNV